VKNCILKPYFYIFVARFLYSYLCNYKFGVFITWTLQCSPLCSSFLNLDWLIVLPSSAVNPPLILVLSCTIGRRTEKYSAVTMLSEKKGVVAQKHVCLFILALCVFLAYIGYITENHHLTVNQQGKLVMYVSLPLQLG